MKNLLFSIAFLAVLCQPAGNLLAQAQQKNASQVIGELLFALLVSDIQQPQKKAAPKKSAPALQETYIRSELFGVWVFDDCMVFIEDNWNFSVTTPSYSEVLFSGTYDFDYNKLSVYQSDDTFYKSWKVTKVKEGVSLTLKPSDGGLPLTGYYKCSVEEFFNRKSRELANLTANADRFVAQQNGYAISQGIRNDVQSGSMRRTYDTERVKALENAKYYRQRGNEDQARAWEKNAAAWEYEIKKLDDRN